jgi:hypothetical protein
VLFTPQVRSDAAAGPAAAAGPGSTGSTGPAAVAGPGSTPGAASGSAAAPEGERPHRAPDGGPEDRDDDGRADQRQTPPGPIFRPFAPPVSEEPGDDAGADPAPDAANGTPAWVGGSGAGTGLRVPQE